MLSTLLCSIDTLFAATLIGVLSIPVSRRQPFILAFALSDAFATLLGADLHVMLPSTRGVELLFVVVIAASFVFAVTVRRHPVSVILCYLPILFSVDNFLTALDGGPPSSATTVIFTSALTAAFAWCGFRASDLWSRPPGRTPRFGSRITDAHLI
jgi:hypothetical protein